MFHLMMQVVPPLSKLELNPHVSKQKKNIFTVSNLCQNACTWSFTIILTNYNSLDLGSFLAYYEAPPAVCFRKVVKNAKIWFSSHNFMTNVEGAINTHHQDDKHLHQI